MAATKPSDLGPQLAELQAQSKKLAKDLAESPFSIDFNVSSLLNTDRAAVSRSALIEEYFQQGMHLIRIPPSFDGKPSKNPIAEGWGLPKNRLKSAAEMGPHDNIGCVLSKWLDIDLDCEPAAKPRAVDGIDR